MRRTAAAIAAAHEKKAAEIRKREEAEAQQQREREEKRALGARSSLRASAVAFVPGATRHVPAAAAVPSVPKAIPEAESAARAEDEAEAARKAVAAKAQPWEPARLVQAEEAQAQTEAKTEAAAASALAEDDAPLDECAICLEPMRRQEHGLEALPCGCSVYHSACIQPCLAVKRECPSCRTPVPEEW